MTPAQRGTALHEFMQFADFPAAAKDPEQELQRLVAGAYLTPEQAAAVDRRQAAVLLRQGVAVRRFAVGIAAVSYTHLGLCLMEVQYH